MAAKETWHSETGKRKAAIARVSLKEGKGGITVNRRSFEEYFPTPSYQRVVTEPFQVTSTLERFTVRANVAGGGVSAQAQAVAHGIAKILAELDREKFRSPLKKAELLTRDARVKERKKYGQPGARKRFQFSKR